MHTAHAPRDYATSPQWYDGRFRNAAPVSVLRTYESERFSLWDFMFRKPANTQPHGAIPLLPLTPAQLAEAPDHSLWRLGHSTLLLKLGGRFFLTDPVFCRRASPLQWLGPRRFHAPPITLRELPPIEAAILSHDHYDHLDRSAIRTLARKTARFVVPLGVGARLRRWDVAADRIRELDWWQDTTVADVRLTCTPAQHFSGRTPFDRNTTLWCSWMIEHAGRRVFFSGDGGYSEGFAQIRSRIGAPDIACIENGAYNAAWPDVHMPPEGTLQAHLDLGARWLLPIHNGTFDLAMHAWTDPLDRITALAAAHDVSLATPRIGERFDLDAPQTGQAWWRGVDRETTSGMPRPRKRCRLAQSPST